MAWLCDSFNLVLGFFKLNISKWVKESGDSEVYQATSELRISFAL